VRPRGTSGYARAAIDVREPILDFLHVARTAGIAVTPGDTLDVFAALERTGYADRETLHAVLRLIVAKSNDERASFDACFARFFGGDGLGVILATDTSPVEDDGFARPEIVAAVADSALAQTLLADDRARLVLELQAAAAAAGVAQIQLFTQTNLFVQRILQQLDVAALGDAIERLRSSGDPRQVRAADFLDLRQRAVRELARDIVERRLGRRAGDRSRERDGFLRDARVANIDPRERERMRELVRAMAKRLATRRGRARRHERRGVLDVRSTLRANVAHDGVLVETVFKTRAIERPRLLVLCDVSGSVAALAQFLLLFVHSLSAEIADIRSFAFSGPLVEITEIMRRETPDGALAAIMRLVGFRSSDYGRAFANFNDGFGAIVDRKTTVVVLGDARTNHADPRLDLVARFASRAKRLVWLNPEARVAWGMDDSEMLHYLPLCTIAKTCNRLRHLEAVVDDLLKSR